MMVSNLMKNNFVSKRIIKGIMWVHFTPPKKKNPLRSVSEWVAGGDSRSRTDDPLLAKQML